MLQYVTPETLTTCFVSCDVLQTDVSENRMEYRRVSPSASDLPETYGFSLCFIYNSGNDVPGTYFRH